MNEVSIIINGVRYDAVDAEKETYCDTCDLLSKCNEIDGATGGQSTNACFYFCSNKVFKKSTKSFEK